MTDPTQTFLRHTLATLAYRAGRVCENAPPGFSDFRATDSTRTAGAVLAHMGDLLDWAANLATGSPKWQTAAPLSWPQETDRFFAMLARLDGVLASDAPLACPMERLFQGPIADALTHVGHLAMLRRAAGSPMLGENYFKADIAIGRVGKDPGAATIPFR
ncbi:MAG: hypothetical protein K8R92_04705 [Planctomycetes bacterium]|nr:hypothetical protein [Planctomycetota bacterium]